MYYISLMIMINKLYLRINQMTGESGINYNYNKIYDLSEKVNQ